MPRNLSAWSDLVIHLAIMLVMIAILSQYNKYLAAIAFVVWLMLALFARERCRVRVKQFREYCENVVGGGKELMTYAMANLPQAVIIIDENGNLQWCNELTKNFTDINPEQGMNVEEFWKGILNEEIFESAEEDSKQGRYTAQTVRSEINGEGEEFSVAKYFVVRYRRLKNQSENYPTLIALFIQETTKFEELKIEYKNSRTVLAYVQVDNYDEIMQGLNEAEKTSLMLSVSEELEKWMKNLSGFMQKVSNDLFVVALEYFALQKAIREKFVVLDSVRKIISKNGIPVTLSMGISVADKHSSEQSMSELGTMAQERLNAALSRGGDQVAIILNGKPQYFGGRAKAVEKHNRVRARVTANSIREHMESADEIFVMGHNREDFDAFGAAMGVAVMARHIHKPVKVILSSSLDSIEKILDQFRKDKNKTYEDVLVKAEDFAVPTSINPLLVVVDTHIPYMTAMPSLLERIQNVIVIDHHRKSDVVIKNPVIFYHEPSSSSASELVTELLMYFDDRITLGRLAATALYSGIVVDTKSFVVQTGVRTFDAAAYLRRNGADPVVVRELFMSDYETTVALAKAKAQAEYYEGGLIVTSMPNLMQNIQAMAGQAADALLTIEGVRMTIILFQMPNDVVGISARSSGTLNVQVIMEKFGGGGHQNVAGAQVRGTNILELEKQVVAAAQKYISETDAEDEDF